MLCKNEFHFIIVNLSCLIDDFVLQIIDASDKANEELFKEKGLVMHSSTLNNKGGLVIFSVYLEESLWDILFYSTVAHEFKDCWTESFGIIGINEEVSIFITVPHSLLSQLNSRKLLDNFELSLL